MSLLDRWFIDSSLLQQGARIASYQRNIVSTCKVAFWDRLFEPRIVLSLLVLVVSVALAPHLLDLVVVSAAALAPAALRQRAWCLLVTVTPAAVLFAVDDWLSPFPRPRQSLDRLTPQAAFAVKSGVLERILGLHPGGRRSNLHHIGRSYTSALASISSISTAGLATKLSGIMSTNKTSDRGAPPGLRNPAYFCYQNSVLQGLSSLSSIQSLCDRFDAADRDDRFGGFNLATTRALVKMMRNLYLETHNGEVLSTPPILAQLNTFAQQDAQEYYTKLLDCIDKEMKATSAAIGPYSSLAMSASSSRTSSGTDPAASVQPMPSRNAITAPSSGGGGQPYAASSDKSIRHVSVGTAPLFSIPSLLAPQPARSSHSSHSSSSSQSSQSDLTALSSLVSSQDPAPTLSSILRIPLEGLWAERFVCTACNHSDGLRLNAFQAISLNVGSTAPHRTWEKNIEDLLDDYCSAEEIQGVRCVRCTLIHNRGVLEKFIAAAPQSQPDHLDGSEAPEMRGDGRPDPFAAGRTKLEKIENALFKGDYSDEVLDAIGIPSKSRIEVTKSKQVGLGRAPASLAFHMNRSEYNAYTDMTEKLLNPVCFPLRLDLGPWYLGSAAPKPVPSSIPTGPSRHSHSIDLATLSDKDKTTLTDLHVTMMDDSEAALQALDGPGSNLYDEDAEQWQLPAKYRMVSGSKNPSRLKGPVYELRAVVVHQGGGHSNGHYICYRQHGVSKTLTPPQSDANMRRRSSCHSSVSRPSSMSRPPFIPGPPSVSRPSSSASHCSFQPSSSPALAPYATPTTSSPTTPTVENNRFFGEFGQAPSSLEGAGARTARQGSLSYSSEAETVFGLAETPFDNTETLREASETPEERFVPAALPRSVQRPPHVLPDRIQEPGAAPKPAQEKKWWCLSDEIARQSDESIVLGQASGVFMLFYDRIDDASTLVPARTAPTCGAPTPTAPKEAGLTVPLTPQSIADPASPLDLTMTLPPLDSTTPWTPLRKTDPETPQNMISTPAEPIATDGSSNSDCDSEDDDDVVFSRDALFHLIKEERTEQMTAGAERDAKVVTGPNASTAVDSTGRKRSFQEAF